MSIPSIKSSIASALAFLTLGSNPALGQDDMRVVDAQPVEANASIESVTLYLGRASVTRRAPIDLQAGAYALRFANLPEAVQPQTIQARATGAVKVLGVDFAQEQAAEAQTPELKALDAKIADLQRQLKEIAEQRDLIKSQHEFLNAVSVRATSDASQEAGTTALDLDAIRKQMEFVTTERSKLLAAARELDAKESELQKQLPIEQSKRQAMASAAAVSRTAVVSIVVTEAAPASVDLTYLVTNATWSPEYSVRASLNGSTTTIEYDALLVQRTGEDWNDVQLTLSTAQPTLAANPPVLQPWFVDIYRPEQEAERSRRLETDARIAPAPAARMKDAGTDKPEDLARLAADAQVGGAGPSVTFQLPRAVTVKTNIDKQQRTRIANIDTRPLFVHVAVPELTEAVYIRGELTNASPYLLLPGRASIFVGQDYVGATTLGSVASNAQFQLHFGIDQSVKARRQLVAKNTENTGLLSGGRRTSYDYRLTLDNGTGKPIALELWDRAPVSRTEEVQIELVDISVPLANDTKYVNEQRPQGLLKWFLNVPADATGDAAAVVTYGVRIDRAKDVEMTSIPE